MRHSPIPDNFNAIGTVSLELFDTPEIPLVQWALVVRATTVELCVFYQKMQPVVLQSVFKIGPDNLQNVIVQSTFRMHSGLK
jgi:hypothetical protein